MWLDSVVDENEALSQTQRLDYTEEKPEPGAFKGSLDVLGPGLLRGGIEAGSAIESGFSSLWQAGLDTAADVLLPEPKFGGKVSVTSMEETAQETLGEGTAKVVQDLRPDPAEVGVVGQILGEAAAVLPRTAIAAAMGGPVAGAVAAGAPAGYSGKQVAMAEGIDESTATLKGVIDATTTGVGAVMPAAKFVKPLLGDAAISVGANVGLGMAGRGATAELLEGGGYNAQAAQYRAMDGLAVATDAILGAAFFGIGRAGMPRPTSDQINAALSERTTQHFDVDTAPGAPADPRSATAHQEALGGAIDQLSRGETVSLPESIHSAEFVATDRNPIGDAASNAFRDSLGSNVEELGAIPRARDLSPEDRAVETNLADKVGRNYKGAVEEYNALPDAEGGKVLNVDTARELSPEYAGSLEARSRLSPAVHEPASHFIKQLYKERLATLPKNGTVMFTSGGTGAGKSTAIRGVPEAAWIERRASIVYDTNMNGLKSAQAKIEQALKAGAKVEIVHVQRDPVDALVNGALIRAARVGRTVPLDAHEATHIGSAQTITKLAEIYKGNKRVKIQIIDNTRGIGSAQPAGIEFLKQFDYSNLHGRLVSALEREYQDGKISEAVYRGTLGRTADAGRSDTASGAYGQRASGVEARLSEGQRGRDSNADGRRGSERLPASELGPRQTDPQQKVDPDPIVQVADDILARADDIRIATGAIDEEGNPVTMSAREMLADADADIAKAQDESKGFAAAAACFLQRGE